MGQKPDEIAREIGDLRRETEVIIDELVSRASPSHVARSASTAAAHQAETLAGSMVHQVESTADRVSQSLPQPVRSTPILLGGALGLLASLGFFALSNVTREPEHAARGTAADRMRAALSTVEGRYGRPLGGTVDQLGRAARSAFQPALSNRMVVRREEPSMFKRLVWVGLVSVAGALGAMLFQRLAATMWRNMMHENPPKK